MLFKHAAALGLAFGLACPSREPSPGLAPDVAQQGASTRAPSDPREAKLVLQLEHIADELFVKEKDGIAGMVLHVARGNRTLISKAYGWADIASRRPLGTSNVFRIGSVTKQFTAAAVLRLVELGKLGMDDPLSRYVPEFPDPGRRVTVQQLLSHTSGIVSYTDLPWFATHRQGSLSPSELVALVGNEPLSFPPGTQFKYSNSGYWLLGLIVERASGERYADFLRDAVISRAGLASTRYCPDSQDYPSAALGYDRVDGRPAPAPSMSMSMPFAAGALCSTAADLVRWSQALRAGRVISADDSARMRQSTLLPDGARTNYGFGIGFDDSLGTPMEGHNGSIPGFMADLYYLPQHDIDIAVLVNTLVPGGFPLTPRLVQAITADR